MSWKNYKISDFICPHCGKSSEILARARVVEYRRIYQLTKLKHSVFPDLVSEDLGDGRDYEIDEFVCYACNETIAFSEEELFKWLEEHAMLLEIKYEKN